MENTLLSTISEYTYGMALEAVEQSGGLTTVRTTGAVFSLDSGTGKLTIRQRIGTDRELATLCIPPERFAGAVQVVDHQKGGVVLKGAGGVTLQINSDSLCGISCDKETWMTLRLAFAPDFQSHAMGNSMYMDNNGGICAFPWREKGAPEPFPPRPQGVASTENCLPVDIIRVEPMEELWLSVAPPREFDWEKSYQTIYWHRGDGTAFWVEGDTPIPWTPETAWPVDMEFLKPLSERFDIIHLQAEVALWENWLTSYRPRFPDLARECIDKCHSLGLKVVAYMSPFYFLKGTQFENVGMNGPEFPKEWWRCGNYYGDNWPIYAAAVEEALANYELDGIYFDSSFLLSLANTYKMTRRIRSILGPDRILYNHCTYSAPAYSNRISCPAVNTYADYLLRGEEDSDLFADPSHVRYCISDYQFGNSVGLLCRSGADDKRGGGPKAWIDAALKANARLPYDTGLSDELWGYYLSKLEEIRKGR